MEKMKIIKIKPVLAAMLLLAQLTACSEHSAVVGKLPADVATVGIQVKAANRVLVVNQEVVLPISLLNNGVGQIPSKPQADGNSQVFVTYHWFRESGETAVWDGVRTSLPKDIKKGQVVDVQLAIKAPAEPGKYVLVVDLVQEGVLWFADTGSQTAKMNYVIEINK